MKHICQQLDDYYDGLLDPSQTEAFEIHLDACQACRLEIETIRNLDTAIRTEWQTVKAPADLHQVAGNRIASKTDVPPSDSTGNRSWKTGRISKAGLATAASILLLVATAWWIRSTSSDNANLEVVQTPNTIVGSEGTSTQETDNEHRDARSDSDPNQHQLVTIIRNNTNSGSILITEVVEPDFTIVKAYPMLKPNLK